MQKRWMAVSALVIAVAVPAVRAGDGAKERKVRELLELTGAGKMGEQVMDALLAQFKEMPGLRADFLKKFRTMAEPESLIDLIVPIYTKHVDEKTLDALIVFYKTPEGRAFIRVQPKIVQESMAVGNVWGRELARKAMKELRAERVRAGSFQARRVEDMNNVRNLVGLLTVSRKMPMKDGRVDVYAFVRKGEITAQHFSIFKSARFGKGPSKDEIEKGDYENFPYERFRGTVNQGGAVPVPLLWDKKPDERNGRVVGFNNGAVKYYAEAEVQELLKKHGQRKQEND